MKVRAIETGYYGHKRRYAGEVFAIKNKEAFSKKWMEEAEEEVELPKKKFGNGKKGVEVKAEPVDADFAAEHAEEEVI